MPEIWAVIALCASLKGDCVWSPTVPLPSSVACFAFGRKLQLERGLPMNSFRCLKLEMKS